MTHGFLKAQKSLGTINLRKTALRLMIIMKYVESLGIPLQKALKTLG
jgi:hypothetical protein